MTKSNETALVEAATRISNVRKQSPSKSERQESFGAVLDDGRIAEAVYDVLHKPPCYFIVGNENGEFLSELSFLREGGHLFPPERHIKAMRQGSIILPSTVEEYGSSLDLLNAIKSYLHKYIDLSLFDLSILAHYAVMTWHWDRFGAVPYLRFQGQPGTGKSRCLQVLRSICYRSIDLGVSPSCSALLRSIDLVRGTSFIDEADYEGDFRSDLIKMLNAGYKKDGLRTLSAMKGEDWQPETFCVGGPKVLANRHSFNDRALETRCITIETISKTVDRRVPTELLREFKMEGQSLRNRLLKMRLLGLPTLNNNNDDALRKLDGRARELSLAIHNVSPDPEFQNEFVRYMENRSETLRDDDPTKIVLEAYSLLAKHDTSRQIELKHISLEAIRIGKIRDIPEYVFSSRKTADLIRGLGFETFKRSSGKVILPDRALLKEQSDRFRIRDDSGDDNDSSSENACN